jgi:hypothetical protein
LFAPLLINGQTAQHKIFGINLDLDWTTLTGFQALAFFEGARLSENQYVVTTFEYYNPNIDAKFKLLGFEELLLGFQKNTKIKLSELSPDFFLARTKYRDKEAYQTKSPREIIKAFTLFVREFGEPVLSSKKETYELYKWSDVYFDAILTSRLDELSTTFLYIKK